MTNDERSRLDVIEAKVDTILVQMAYIHAQMTDHETRVRSIEKWKYALPATVVLALGGAIGVLVRGFMGS